MHALVVLNKDDEIVHLVYYEMEPTEWDIISLRKELATDEEFGLTDIIDSLKIKRAKIESHTA